MKAYGKKRVKSYSSPYDDALRNPSKARREDKELIKDFVENDYLLDYEGEIMNYEIKFENGPKVKTFNDVAEEVIRARSKFPNNRFLLTALTEELGELAQAYLQKKSKQEIYEEAMQVAAMAIRIMEEDDAIFLTLTDEESKP